MSVGGVSAALAALPGRWAAHLAGLAGWRRAAAAFLFGGLTSAAMAPLHVLPAAVVGLVGLVWLLDGAAGGRSAFWSGWWFGYGHFIAGLYWIASAFFVEPDRFALLVPLPVLGLPAVLALFPALAALAAHRLGGIGVARILALALAWTALEYLRGQIFTGFPWNLAGYVWAFSDAMLQVTALTGIHGLSLITVATLAMPAVLADGRPAGRARLAAVAVAAALLGALWAGGAVRLAGAAERMVDGVRLRLVQGNVAQADKWRPEMRPAHLRRYLDLSRGAGAASISLFVWPESAVPYYLELDEAVRRLAGEAVAAGDPDRLLLAGTVRRTPPGAAPLVAWNSLLAIDGRGEVRASYDKAHLVPFGEYLPFRPVLSLVGLDKLAAGAVDYSAGGARSPIALPGLPPVRALVCYEAIFAEEIAPTGTPRPGWLLNVTNDAWFGTQTGPYQHFAMARTRAVEQGLPLVRAANTGISAIVDPYGRVRQSLGIGVQGVVDGGLPAALAPTPYARLGDAAPALLWALLGALFLAYRRRHAE